MRLGDKLQSGGVRRLLTAAEGFAARHEARLTVALLALGALWRLVWVLGGGRLAPLRSEVRNVALTYARTGQLADAFGYGTGPTAHVAPTMAIYEGLVYRYLGSTTQAELFLAVVAILLASASFYFTYRAFRLLKTPPLWALAGLAAVCLIPLNAMIEVRQLRGFEGMLATALSTGILWWILALAQRPRLTALSLFPLALVMAFLALTTQAAALGVYGAAGLLVLLRVRWTQWPLAGLVFALALAIFLGPWALRNERAMHHPILTRSNFGLELSQAYYPGAVHPANALLEFKRRHREMHPMASPEAIRELRRVGEVEYAAAQGREAMAWIHSDPKGAATIAVRQFRQYWFPDPWLWQAFDQDVKTQYKMKSYVLWLVTAFGLLGLASGLARDLANWIYVAPALILPSLPYILTQPVIRYRYLISTLLFFLAAEFARRVVETLAGRRSADATPGGAATTG